MIYGSLYCASSQINKKINKIIHFNRIGFTQSKSLPTLAPTETFDYCFTINAYHIILCMKMPDFIP